MGWALSAKPGCYLANRTKLIGIISAAAAAISLGLNYILILHYGMLGAAWATVLSFGVVALGSYFGIRARFVTLQLDLGRKRCRRRCHRVMGLYLPFQWWTPAPLAPGDGCEADGAGRIPHPALDVARAVAETATVLAITAKTHAVYSRLMSGVFGKKPAYESLTEKTRSCVRRSF